MKRHVKIEVTNGVAEVTECPSDVEVFILDNDVHREDIERLKDFLLWLDGRRIDMFFEAPDSDGELSTVSLKLTGILGGTFRSNIDPELMERFDAMSDAFERRLEKHGLLDMVRDDDLVQEAHKVVGVIDKYVDTGNGKQNASSVVKAQKPNLSEVWREIENAHQRTWAFLDTLTDAIKMEFSEYRFKGALEGYTHDLLAIKLSDRKESKAGMVVDVHIQIDDLEKVLDETDSTTELHTFLDRCRELIDSRDEGMIGKMFPVPADCSEADDD